MEFFKNIKIYNNTICKYVKLYNNKKYIGQIFYFFIEDTCYIGNFNVIKNERNKGYGTILLNYCLKDVRDNFNIKIVKLTDISDNIGKYNNIYIKNGFTYLDEQGSMILNFNE
jgi:predicted acetyltransferase